MSEVIIPWAGWELREQLGSGGFGKVYRIENPATGEQSAMKVLSLPKDASEISALRVEGYDNPSIAGIYRNQLNRIINEYALMAQMKGHANIVRSEDCTAAPHADGLGWDVFFRMELLCPLTRYLMQYSLDESEIIRLGTDLCCALVQCERRNIIHRDIKPENIFISEYGVYKLGDFGIARTMDHTTMATHAGSYRYMAPEVYQNARYGKEVDIYSLGLTLYWLLNNRRMPFLPMDRPPRASENEQALQLRLSGTPVPPPVNGSPALQAVVLKACAYDPRDRFRTAEEMLRALEAARDGIAPAYVYESAAAGEPAAAEKPAVGWEVLFLLVMAGVMVILFILVIAMNQQFNLGPGWSECWMLYVWIPCLLCVLFGKTKATIKTASAAMGFLTYFEFLFFSISLAEKWGPQLGIRAELGYSVLWVGLAAAIATVVAGFGIAKKKR